MQAWQSVKVTNESSGFYGQAGTVVRVEKHGEETHIMVSMDLDNSVQSFEPSELVIL